ncbi:MAG: Uncharacterised protein [SAR116 cluster bacterium]|nr:MAG: Uncharacterised protein [SAR116 cluster bacterium]
MVSQSGMTETDMTIKSGKGPFRLTTSSNIRIVWNNHTIPTSVIVTAMVVRMSCASR